MTKHTKPCPECAGQGWTTYERTVSASASVPYGYYEEYTDDCENCGGVGEIDEDDYDEEEGDWLLHKLQDDYGDKGGFRMYQEIKEEDHG